MNTLTKQDISGARRSIIRIFRTQDADFSTAHLQEIKEQWGLMFLHYHFTSKEIRRRWMGSEVFWKWVSQQFDLRNVELLLKCNFGIHVNKPFSSAKFYEFKDCFDVCHGSAITKIYPATPIVHQIQQTIC